MQKGFKLNQENIGQLISLYQMISETNSLDSDIAEMLRRDMPEEKQLIKEKYESFFSKHKEAEASVRKHLSLTEMSSAIFESHIDVLAVEKNVLAGKRSIRPIGKKYSKLRIYYQATDSKRSKNYKIENVFYPTFGILLLCSLRFNSRTFTFEIARTEKGCNDLFSRINSQAPLLIGHRGCNCLSSQTKKLKFCSQEKFAEVLNICEKIMRMVNEEFEKAGLERLMRTIRVSKS